MTKLKKKPHKSSGGIKVDDKLEATVGLEKNHIFQNIHFVTVSQTEMQTYTHTHTIQSAFTHLVQNISNIWLQIFHKINKKKRQSLIDMRKCERKGYILVGWGHYP